MYFIDYFIHFVDLSKLHYYFWLVKNSIKKIITKFLVL